jgi:recombination associated protein RdgC
MFYVPGRMPNDVIARFAAQAAPSLDALGRDPLYGWVTGRHLLDRNITEDTAIVSGYLRLTLMRAERRIPEALLRAECRMEELAEMQASGEAFLKREVRSRIRKEVSDRLLPTMPPTLTGIPMVYDDREDLVYAGATSDKQVDAFIMAFKQATGHTLIPVMPETAAMKRGQVNYRDLAPTSFSPELEDSLAGPGLGQDFLTWLWFFSEARGGLLDLQKDRWAVMIEGPLMFVLEGEGAHETVLRKGTPLVSAEAKTALLSGKKLKTARVTLQRRELSWTATLGADALILRSLKVPKGDALDNVSRFQERMLALNAFREALMGFFDKFLEDRSSAAWSQTRQDIHKWVSGRQSRR